MWRWSEKKFVKFLRFGVALTNALLLGNSPCSEDDEMNIRMSNCLIILVKRAIRKSSESI